MLVFCLMLISSTILGYKKGWRGAIFVSVLLLSFTMIWVGIGYLIYHSALWPLYRDKILANDLRVHLNLDTLATTFKLRIVLLFTGILTPLSFLFTYLIWKFSQEKINKYMGPKTKDIGEKNRKEMIYRKSAVPSRIGGVVIMGGSTILVSSMTASAISTISIPYRHRDGFTDFYDSLGSIYGLGQISNSSDAAAIQAFMKEIDGPMVDGIQELANFGSGYNTKTNLDNFIPNFKTITDTFQGGLWQALNDLMQDDDKAAAGIFNLILKSNSNAPTINPLRFDATTNTDTVDANGNQVGYGSARTMLLSQVQSELKANHLSISLIPQVIKTLVDYISSSFIGFDKTVFAKNLVEAKTGLTSYEEKLSQANTKLKDEQERLRSSQSKLESYVQEYKNLNGQEYISTSQDGASGNGSHTTSSPVSYKEYVRQTPPSSPLPGTLLQIARAEQTAAQHEYDTYNTNIYGPKLTEYNAALNVFNQADSTKTTFDNNVKSAKTTLDQAQDKLRNEQQAKIAEEAKLQKQQTDLDTVNVSLTQYNAQLQTIDAQLLVATQNESTLAASISTKETEKSTLEGEIQSLESQIQAKESDLATATTEQEKTTIRGEIQQLQNQKTTKTSSLNIVNKELIDLNNRHDQAVSNKTSLDTQKNTLNQNIATSTTTKINLESSIKGLQQAISVHNTNISRYTSEASIAQANWQSSADIYNNHVNNIWTPANETKKRVEIEYKKVENELYRLYGVLSTKNGEVQNHIDRATTLKDSITSENTSSRVSAIEIAKLLRNTGIPTSDLQQATDPPVSPEEKESIKYMEWRIRYQKSIIANRQTIYDRKLVVYNNLKKELIASYSAWLRKEN